MVDVRSAVKANRDHRIGVAEFETWERQHGAVPSGAIVLLQTGYDQYWPDAERYLGTAEP